MTEYLSPTAYGTAEVTEKRSRFIGHIMPVTTEAEARDFIARISAQHRDARHNCWCYLLRGNDLSRFSDDGEPSGTAGAPMLETLRREGVCNVVCVVTRYFGGVLLGPGGLVRAYTAAAKAALAQAFVVRCVARKVVSVAVPYALIDRVKHEISSCGGDLKSAEYLDVATLFALFDDEGAVRFATRVHELTAGSVSAEVVGEEIIALGDGK
ncbi:MAG: YigZ family protein [Oscillospiraceae bacterium]|jgi:uncharacterized YigZ family protein|nr:YigZ family protein [Oscillospiraceae bacterium]